jgi:hypothetical protein
VGHTSLQVAALLNWEVGDTVVVASSSFLAHEVDERVVVQVELGPGGATTILHLDVPLTYTHLGEVADFDGEKVDMRAEVAVLTRNVKVQGDVLYSERQKYGAHILVHDHTSGHCTKGLQVCGNHSSTVLAMAFFTATSLNSPLRP